MLGQYPADGLVGYEQYLPDGWQEDLKTIQQPLDFYGQNIYQGQWWRRGADGKPEHVRYPAGHPHNALEWPINEDGLYLMKPTDGPSAQTTDCPRHNGKVCF